MIDGIQYLNSGDWVETMSALLEHEDGTWEVYMHRNHVQKTQPQEIKEITRNPTSSFHERMKVAFSF